MEKANQANSEFHRQNIFLQEMKIETPRIVALRLINHSSWENAVFDEHGAEGFKFTL